MEFLKPLLTSGLFWGFVAGLFLAGMSVWNHWKTKRDFGRYKKMLSDKMELESENYRKLKEEKEKLAQENENLRLKVGSSTGAHSVRDLERELEIYARAEKRMIINAPGFGGAWESAKSASNDELLQEERGKSIPKKIFRKFFRADATPTAEVVESLPEKGEASSSSSAPT
ncbi:MAG: hypothetical protein AAGJ31_08180 [Verrucomicrobiota bacterium]